MSEKINSLNLCVCMALADHGLGKDETAEILKIAKEIKVDFNVHNATDEIDKKFSGDIDMAQDFYLGNITKDDFKFRVKDFVKRVALSDGELKDKDVTSITEKIQVDPSKGNVEISTMHNTHVNAGGLLYARERLPLEVKPWPIWTNRNPYFLDTA